MKKNNTSLTDAYLESLQGMKEAETDPFFYTRLRSKMEQKKPGRGINWQSVFALSVLLIFLFVNLWMVAQQKNYKNENSTSQLQNFARTYDLTVPDYN